MKLAQVNISFAIDDLVDRLIDVGTTDCRLN